MPIASPSNRRLRRQNKQSAAKYISNVEIGIFPSTKDVEQIPRWIKSQQKKLDQAKVDGTWQSSGWFSKEFDFMVPDAALASTVNESESEGVLSRIAGFGALGNLF